MRTEWRPGNSTVEEKAKEAGAAQDDAEAAADRQPGGQVWTLPTREKDNREKVGPLPERKRDGKEGLGALRPWAVGTEAEQDAAEDPAREAEAVKRDAEDQAEKQATDAAAKCDGLGGHARIL